MPHSLPLTDSRPVPTLSLIVTLIGLVAIGVGTAWGVVHGGPILPLAVIGTCAALIIWVLEPGAPLYVLIALTPFALPLEVAGLDLRIHDGLIVALGLSAAAALPSAPARLKRFSGPFAVSLLALWAFLMFWQSLAYLVGPANQSIFSDALHNAWYVYKATVRPMLALPLVAFCMDGPRTGRRMITTLLAVGTVVALDAIRLAMLSGSEAVGPFEKKNQLAGWLVLVVPFAVARLLEERNMGPRLLLGAILVVLLRALWLSGSRGGLVAFLASLLPFALLVPRRKILAAGLAGLVALSIAAAARGDLLQRPGIQRLLTLSNPVEVENMRWREAQWRWFLGRVAEHPVLGTGSDEDESLLDLGRAATAHNAFLAFAMSSGIPAAAAWLFLLLWAGRQALARGREAADAPARTFWTGLLGCLVAAFVNNLVETNLVMFQMQLLFWILLGLAVAWSGRPAAGASGAARA